MRVVRQISPSSSFMQFSREFRKRTQGEGLKLTEASTNQEVGKILNEALHERLQRGIATVSEMYDAL